MKKIIKEYISEVIISLKMPSIDIPLQIPKNKDHGDLSTNVAFILAKKLGGNPMDIATNIYNELEKSDLFTDITIANPGFINLKINPKMIFQNLKKIIINNENYGRNNYGENKKVLLEFVSANPTGRLTVGHGRGAILGDC